jgi:hypothetical protein
MVSVWWLRDWSHSATIYCTGLSSASWGTGPSSYNITNRMKSYLYTLILIFSTDASSLMQASPRPVYCSPRVRNEGVPPKCSYSAKSCLIDLMHNDVVLVVIARENFDSGYFELFNFLGRWLLRPAFFQSIKPCDVIMHKVYWYEKMQVLRYFEEKTFTVPFLSSLNRNIAAIDLNFTRYILFLISCIPLSWPLLYHPLYFVQYYLSLPVL